MHVDMSAVLLDDPEDHRQPEAAATLTFGGEERLEHAGLDLGAHAHARIYHLDDPPAVLGYDSEPDRATRWQGVDRIEDEVGHQLAQARRRALNSWIPLGFDVQIDAPTVDLSCVA